MNTPFDPSKLAAMFDRAPAAPDNEPLPAGDYTAEIESGELGESRNGTPCYKLAFRVVEGEHDGRPFWHDLYLTDRAIGYARRDLLKLGITDGEALNKPFPPGVRCKVKLTVRSYDGRLFNRVHSFDVLTGTADPFAPKAGAS